MYWVVYLGAGGALCIENFQSYPSACDFAESHPDSHIFGGNLLR